MKEIPLNGQEMIANLNRICGEYKKVEKPMTYKNVKGETWTFASDGHILVAVKADLGFAEPTFKWESAVDRPEKMSRISFETLVRFVDSPPEWDEKDEDACEFCGAYAAPRRYGMIDDCCFSRELLARIIETIPTHPKTIEAGINYKHETGQYLFLSAEDWTAVLMAIKKEGYASYPEGWQMPVLTLTAAMEATK